MPNLDVDGDLEFIADISHGDIEIGDHEVEVILTDTVTGNPGESLFIPFEVLEYDEYLEAGNESATENGSASSDEFSLTYSGDSDSC